MIGSFLTALYVKNATIQAGLSMSCTDRIR